MSVLNMASGNDPVMLTFGPPGTGKTEVVAVQIVTHLMDLSSTFHNNVYAWQALIVITA